jgi:hypothetical protein
MPTIVFDNLSKESVTLVVEPWAMAEPVLPNGKAFVEYDDPNAEISFAILEDGAPCIGIMADMTFRVGDRLIYNSRKFHVVE